MSDENLFPIRDLSEKTKVNTVTLRAWERRYGLLKPQRTPKGHRLYSQQDVQRVEEILTLISRGVSVGKVKSLLDAPAKDDQVSEIGDSWLPMTETFLGAAKALNGRQLDKVLSDAFRHYPAKLCRENLILPAMQQLTRDQESLPFYFFVQSELVRYAFSNFASMNKQARTQAITLICGEDTPIWRLALLGMELAEHKFEVQLIGQCIGSSIYAPLCESLGSKNCILYQDGTWNADESARVMKTSKQAKALWLCGTAPMLIKDDLSAERVYSYPEDILPAIIGQDK